MNKPENLHKISQKHQKSIKRSHQDPDRWTFGRSILLLLITFDILIVLVWFVYYFSYYANLVS